MATPLFVLGKQRSGTTWLANQLCEHPLIAGVQHEKHHGIHESAFFSFMFDRYGPLNDRLNYMEFVLVASASDYFKIIGIDQEFLFNLWPTTYEGVFRAVMDKLAADQGAQVWLEKSPMHTPLVGRIADLFPDAKFIAITREPEATTASWLGLHARAEPAYLSDPRIRRKAIIRNVLLQSYYSKAVQAFKRVSPDRLATITFDALKSDTEGTLRKALAFLNIAWDNRILDRTYKPDSSFRQGHDRAKALSAAEKALIRRVKLVAAAVPLPAYEFASYWKRGRTARAPWPRWFFRLTSFCENEGL